MSIIVGMRQIGQIEYLRQNSNLILIALDAPAPLRFERAAVRNKLGEAKTFKAFEDNERKENSPPRAQRLFECMKLADHTISNDLGIANLHNQLEKITERLRPQNSK